ncbi:hypothetical protein COU79_03685 [Candidatus Peregrinibacteria bacterium CG10_big_fil_rev_8_21_14_0_10_54_7]|nr:MAG: hypothetical protein COU79_03685 [Candidatus Peregrinibacteria bacterium CG10_big_fil_rev_8_21_14_0_10_54_7]
MTMMKFFSLPVAAAALLVLSACNGYVSQKPQDAPARNEPAPQIAQEPDPVPVAQQEPAQTPPPAQQPVPTQQQPTPTPTQRSYTAGAIQTYSPTAYAEALADGKTVVIDFHASWCPICAANAPGIRAAFESTNDASVVGFIADYDKETALENQFGVSSQSTLVKVRGNDPQSATKVSTLGPGPLTQEQVATFIRS